MRCFMLVPLRSLRYAPLLIGLLLLGGCGFFGQRTADNGPAPVKAHKVVKTAYSQMGKQYRSGGASPQKGFDCSGLIWWAYRQHGVSVPRITTDQAKTGHAVPKARPRAGDIVVFRTGNSPRGLHTGIYAGEAPSSTARARASACAWKAWMCPIGKASSLLCAASCTEAGPRQWPAVQAKRARIGLAACVL